MESSSLYYCPYCGFERSLDRNECGVCQKIAERARLVESTFRLNGGLYLLGSLEGGLTVYKQQVRAHNLVWALWEMLRRGETEINNIAIVGGGIAGITTAACCLSRFDENVSIALFEKHWDLCPLQQGSDHRWLHPNIYDWPRYGSRAPGASLPILNWTEGRASDVARTLVRDFYRFGALFGQRQDRLTIYLATENNFRINGATNEIEWTALIVKSSPDFEPKKHRQGGLQKFTTVILTPGFGLEKSPNKYPTHSYWRNEQLAQPNLNKQEPIRYLISGFGDGALIDLCRLTIEWYRQDTILYELFGDNLSGIEEKLEEERSKAGSAANTFNFFNRLGDLFVSAQEQLRSRLRKDTKVVMHIAGKDGKVTSVAGIFGPFSSFQNRMLTFLLYRCGAFTPVFTSLGTAIRKYRIPSQNVICRYGPDALTHVRSLFIKARPIQKRLKELKEKREQIPDLFWEPGTFPQRPVRIKSK